MEIIALDGKGNTVAFYAAKLVSIDGKKYEEAAGALPSLQELYTRITLVEKALHGLLLELKIVDPPQNEELLRSTTDATHAGSPAMRDDDPDRERRELLRDDPKSRRVRTQPGGGGRRKR